MTKLEKRIRSENNGKLCTIGSRNEGGNIKGIFASNNGTYTKLLCLITDGFHQVKLTKDPELG